MQGKLIIGRVKSYPTDTNKFQHRYQIIHLILMQTYCIYFLECLTNIHYTSIIYYMEFVYFKQGDKPPVALLCPPLWA